MPIKKPSDYFKKNNKVVDEESVQESLLDTSNLILDNEVVSESDFVSDALTLFKENLNRIETLSDFSETIKNYKSNIQKIEDIAEKVELIQSQVEKILKKENIDQSTSEKLSSVHQNIGTLQEEIGQINTRTLKKPSEYFDDSDDIIVDTLDVHNDLAKFSDTFEDYSQGLVKINYLFEKIDDIQNEIKTLFKKEDLEKTIMSQLIVFEENIDNIRKKIENIGDRNILEVQNKVLDLTELVNNFTEVEIPKYKKTLVESKFHSEDRLNQFEEQIDNFSKELLSIEQKNDKKYIKIVEQLKSKLRQFKEVYDKSKINVELQKSLSKRINELEINILKNDVHVKLQNKNIQQIEENLISALDSLDIHNLEKRGYELTKKIKHIEEVFENFNENKIISESVITELPSTKNTDPLTPLDQKYVTLDQLQEHYRLFINRIQQQLSTLGGGGETRLKYLDDVVGIATNPSAYDGKYLKYNHSINKFEFSSVNLGDLQVRLQDLTDVNPAGLDEDAIMIWNVSLQQFVFVDPKIYFGINNDANPDPDIDDFGSY